MADLLEIKSLIEDQGKAWDAFNTKNEERLVALEALAEDTAKKAGRPYGLVGSDSGSRANTPELKALTGAVRALLTGNQAKADELFIEAKAMSVGSDPDGGYVVNPLISVAMTTVMAEISPLYRLARKIQMSAHAVFEEPIDRDDAEASWVSEAQSRGETGTPQLGMFQLELQEIYAAPKVSQKLVDTASLDVLGWLNGKVGTAFAEKEGNAYHNGNGVGLPHGILQYTIAALPDSTRTWGEIEYIATGASGAFKASTTSFNTADPLVDVVSALKAQYRNGAVWLMNKKTAGAVRKLKDAEGRHIWLDSLVAGQPSTLLGYGVEIDESMPDIAADSLSIAFGNFARAYTIIEQPGAKFLTDPYTAKPHVILYAYRRVNAAVNNSEAYKLLKFATA
jgi:HK97 family phage major capsid protein